MNNENTQLPPHSPEMEMSLIGCILSGESQSLNSVLAEAKAEMFYDLRNSTIFSAVEGLAMEGHPVNIITVRQSLQDGGMLESAGGLAHLTACLDSCPSPSMWMSFLETVTDKHTRRRLGAVCASIGARVHSSMETQDLVDQAERDLLAVRGNEVKGERTMRDYAMSVLGKIESDMSGDGMRGLSTGHRMLDAWTKGLKPSNLVIIAALTGMGKSAMAMQMAARVAIEERLPVAVFSLEMSGEEMTERVAKQRARWEGCGQPTQGEMKAMGAAIAQISSAPMHIDDEGGLSISQIRARARRMHQRSALSLIVVDYLQLVSGAGRNNNRTVEVSEVARGLKEMAKELNVPVIALAQLNRASATEDRRPGLHDLREGGIEHHADIALLIHTKEDGLVREVDVIVAKNRGGTRGAIKFQFNSPLTEFSEVSPIHSSDAPRR